MTVTPLSHPGEIAQARRVINYWAEHRGLTPEAIKGHRRDRPLIWPRHETMHLMHQSTVLTVPQIGCALGGRDHATVLHGLHKVSERVANLPRYREELEHHARVLTKRNDIVDLQAAVAQRKQRPIRLVAEPGEVKAACMKHFSVADEIFKKVDLMGPVGFYPTYQQCFIFVLWLFAQENEESIAKSLGAHKEWVRCCLKHIVTSQLKNTLFKYDVLKILELVYAAK